MAVANLQIEKSQSSSLDLSAIVMALSELGGAAHLSTLMERLAYNWREFGYRAPPSRRELFEALVAHSSPSLAEADESSCFYRPFGSDSLRWCLAWG